MTATQPAGYLAVPPSGKGSPVLVLHAWWGLNSTIKAFCDRLAENGFTAFAADLYHGKVTDKIPEAEQFATALEQNVGAVIGDIMQAIQFLKEQTGESSMAVVGFSLGAFYALVSSANAPDAIRAVVTFYGSGPADFSQSKAEYLAHYAENDPYEPAENRQYIEGALKEAGRPATIHLYNGVGHWFFEPDRPDAYHAEAANLAWERTVAFLKRSAHL